MYNNHAILNRSPVTWILVSDGKQSKCFARIVTKKTVPVTSSRITRSLDIYDQELKITPEMVLHAEPEDIYERSGHRLGRVFQRNGSGQHLTEPHITIRDEIKTHFAKLIAKHVNEAKEKGSFDNLVLIAPAKMLGLLRRELSKPAHDSVVSSLSKNLVYSTEDKIISRLKNTFKKLDFK